jgi:hypothetical protein
MQHFFPLSSFLPSGKWVTKLFLACLKSLSIMGTFWLMAFSANAQSEHNIFDLARNGELEAMKTLLEAHPEHARSRDENGYSALILAAYHNHPSLVALLAPLDDVNYSSGFGTALMGAAVKGSVDIAQILIDHGADPNSEDGDATTPLIYASMFQNNELALRLLKAGADPKHTNQKGFSALDYARRNKNTALIIQFESHQN